MSENISAGIFILTREDLEARKAEAFKRGVERGKFEALAPKAGDLLPHEEELMEIIDPGCTDMSEEVGNAEAVRYWGAQSKRQQIARPKAKQILAYFTDQKATS